MGRLLAPCLFRSPYDFSKLFVYLNVLLAVQKKRPSFRKRKRLTFSLGPKCRHSDFLCLLLAFKRERMLRYSMDDAFLSGSFSECGEMESVIIDFKDSKRLKQTCALLLQIRYQLPRNSFCLHFSISKVLFHELPTGILFNTLTTLLL